MYKNWGDAGRDWGQEEKGTTEDEMAGWHHWLDGRGSQWTPGVGDGQGGLACCSSWGCKESDTTEWLIWSDLTWLKSSLGFSAAYHTGLNFLLISDTWELNFFPIFCEFIYYLKLKKKCIIRHHHEFSAGKMQQLVGFQIAWGPE